MRMRTDPARDCDHVIRCTFDEDVEFEHPLLSGFADCRYACLSFPSLQCSAIEFEPDRHDIWELSDTDHGRYVVYLLFVTNFVKFATFLLVCVSISCLYLITAGTLCIYFLLLIL
jgi:hypothetical protein